MQCSVHVHNVICSVPCPLSMCMLVGAAPSASQGSGVAAQQSREVLDGLMAGTRPGLPAPTSGSQPLLILQYVKR